MVPWQKLKAATNKQKYDHIMEKKMTNPNDPFCHGFSNEFGIFLKYTHVLCFDNKPDYSYLHKLFHEPFIHEGYQYDDNFNWSVQRAQDDSSTGKSFTTSLVLGVVINGPHAWIHEPTKLSLVAGLVHDLIV